MDKLKEQLAVVKEHSFWILCGGILLFSLVSWYLSTGALQEQQKKYKGEIESAVNTLKQVSETRDHPNDSTSKGMDAITQKFGDDVYQAWARLAENQEQVLVWGGIFGTDEKFQVDVRSLRPIETKVEGEIINRGNRTLYRDFIGGEVPKLADITRSKWKVDAHALGSSMPGMTGGAGPMGAGGAGLSGPGGMTGGMPGMAGGAGAAAKEEDPSVVVVWSESNQKEITQRHFGMSTNSDAIPSTLDVLYAQEDLWVFENLLKIIRDTNGKDITRRHEAAIKYIEYVRIGSSAGGVEGQVTIPGGNNSSGNSNMMPGGMSSPGSGTSQGGGAAGMMAAGGVGAGGAGGPPGGAGITPPPGAMPGTGGPPSTGGPAGAAGGTTPSSTTPTAATDRYVDLSYASIKDITRLRNAMKGLSTKPEDMLLAVAKRMPVRMQFRMDQRKLTTLLAECGNSKLPVEVRQVRINKGTASSQGGAGGSGGPPGMGGGMMPMGGGASMGPPGGTGGGAGGFGGAGGAAGMMGMGSGGAAGGAARPASSIASSKEDPNEITVEIYGIVYIYNPPDRKLLGLPEPVVTTPPAAVPGPVPTPTSTKPAGPVPPVTAGAATGR